MTSARGLRESALRDFAGKAELLAELKKQAWFSLVIHTHP